MDLAAYVPTPNLLVLPMFALDILNPDKLEACASKEGEKGKGLGYVSHEWTDILLHAGFHMAATKSNISFDAPVTLGGEPWSYHFAVAGAQAVPITQQAWVASQPPDQQFVELTSVPAPAFQTGGQAWGCDGTQQGLFHHEPIELFDSSLLELIDVDATGAAAVPESKATQTEPGDFDETSPESFHPSSSPTTLAADTSPESFHLSSSPTTLAADTSPDPSPSSPTASTVSEGAAPAQGVKCFECGKLLKNKGTLRVHRQTHRKSRERKCPVCGLVLSHQRSGYTRHLRDKHLQDADGNPVEPKFKCDAPGCKTQVKRADHYLRHMKRHPEAAEKCEKCKFFCCTQLSMQRHLRDRHNMVNTDDNEEDRES